MHPLDLITPSPGAIDRSGERVARGDMHERQGPHLTLTEQPSLSCNTMCNAMLVQQKSVGFIKPCTPSSHAFSQVLFHPPPREHPGRLDKSTNDHAASKQRYRRVYKMHQK